MQNYFDAKHLEKELNRGRENTWCFFFKISALFGQHGMLPKFSRLGPAVGVARCSYRMQICPFIFSLYFKYFIHCFAIMKE